MKTLSVCLLIGLIAFSVGQKGFFPDSDESSGYDSYEVPSSGQDESFESSSEELALATRSNVKRSEPQYGEANYLDQNDGDGKPLIYEFMGRKFPNIFDVGRHQSIQAFRKACGEAQLEGMGPKKCYDCLEDLADATIHTFDDVNTLHLASRVEKCSSRYLKRDSKFGQCHDHINDETLMPNPDDQYMTMQHFSQQAIDMDSNKRMVWNPPPLTWAWQFPMSNFYRCIHSQSLMKQKSACGGDASCISNLFDKSMNTPPKPPRNLRITPVSQRVQGYDAKLQQVELRRHNALRALHGTPPLELDDDLIVFAQEYANYIGPNNIFAHNEAKIKEMGYGENIYKYSGSPYAYDGSCTQSWYNEKKDYDFSNPMFRGIEYFDDDSMNGHFTQVVWKTSKRVGFGITEYANGGIAIVANYDPPGNYDAHNQNSLIEHILPLCSEHPHDGCNM